MRVCRHVALLRTGVLAAVVAATALFAGCGDGDDRTDAERAVESAMKDTAPAHGVDAEEANDAAEWSIRRGDVVFVSNRAGTSDIYLTRGTDTTVTALTAGPEEDHYPAWSPDGSRIAFQRAVVGEGEADLREQDTFDIYVMNADGSGLTRLTDHPSDDLMPSWSPDGRRITFTSWRQEAVDSLPKKATKATTRLVAKPHVYVMNADGSDPRRLIADSPGIPVRVSWSPDGDALVLARREGKKGADIYIVSPADGLVIRRLTADEAADGAPVFSPDGRHVAYHADHGDRSDIVLVDRWGLGREAILTVGRNHSPKWSPDGRWILYTAEGEDGNFDVHAVPREGGNSVILAGGPDRETGGEWRPRP